jgi:hypothetical protein
MIVTLLAAAIRGRADLIVTAIQKDFPPGLRSRQSDWGSTRNFSIAALAADLARRQVSVIVANGPAGGNQGGDPVP